MTYSVELSPGLTLEVDEATCIILRARVGDAEAVHTITNVEQFKMALEDAQVAAVVARDQAEFRLRPAWHVPV